VVTTTERPFLVRSKDGHAEWVDVRKGAADGDRIEVLGNLKAGDMIVRRANDEIREGAPLQEPGKPLGDISMAGCDLTNAAPPGIVILLFDSHRRREQNEVPPVNSTSQLGHRFSDPKEVSGLWLIPRSGDTLADFQGTRSSSLSRASSLTSPRKCSTRCCRFF